MALTLLILSFSLLSGCGQKKEKDAAAQQVLKITITPSVAPTKAPSEVSKDAVVTNGNLTMVNEYLAEKENADSAAADGNGQGADGTGTDGNSADGQGDGSEGDGNQDDGSEGDGNQDGGQDDGSEDDGSGYEE